MFKLFWKVSLLENFFYDCTVEGKLNLSFTSQTEPKSMKEKYTERREKTKICFKYSCYEN
jgi:hypothetical protein